MAEKPSLNILIVDDSASDAGLLARHVEQSGYQVLWKRLDTAAALRTALECKTWDVILCDHAMPGFNGIEALALVRAEGLDLPFIFVSGTIGEDQAVAAMKAGAHDYVMKENLKRLVPAIERELREAEGRRAQRAAEQALRASEQQYRSLFEHMISGFAYCRMIFHEGQPSDFVYLAVNRAFETQTGLQNVVGRRATEVIPGLRESGGGLFEVYGRVARTGLPEQFETFLEPLGMWFAISVYSPCAEHFVAQFNVINERKRAEQLLADEAARRRILVEQSSDGIVVIDEQGAVCEANRRYAEMLGYTPEEVLRLHVWDWDAQWDRTQLLAMIQTADETGARFETCHRRKDGTVYDVEISNSGTTIGGRKLVFCVCRDISQRKRAEEQLRKLSRAVEQSPASIVITDTQGRIEYVNPKFVEVTGYSLAEIRGQNPRVLKSGEVAPEVYADLWRTIRLGGEWSGEFHNRRKDGTLFWEHAVISAVKNDAGEVAFFLAVKEDITERKQAEEAQQQSVRRFQLLSQTSGRLLVTEDPQRVVTELCRELMVHLDCQVFFNFLADPAGKNLRLNASGGISAAEAGELDATGFGRAGGGHGPEDGLPMIAERIQRSSDPRMDLVKRLGIQAYCCHPLVAEGWIIGTLFFGTKTRSRFTPEEVELLRTVADQVALGMQRHLSRQRLRESEAEFRAMFEVASIGMAQANVRTGQWLRVNRKLCEITGYAEAEMLQMRVPEITHPEDRERDWEAFQRVVRGDAPNYRMEKRYIRKDAQVAWVNVNMAVVRDVDGRPMHTMATIEDITGRKRLEDQHRAVEAHLRQQQRLESIGTLAGGVAHEINNPVNGIMNYAQLIQDRLPPESPLIEFTGEILRETGRVAGIVRSLLTFARNERQSHSPARIADLVEGTLSLIRTVIRHDQIVLTVSIPDDLPAISCCGQQIQQVLMNLMTNARDALNERYPGADPDKRIKLEAQALDTERQRWVRLTVEDYGTGILPEVRERMFDPFFTTKPRDKGTGLGLSISHGIALEHGGKLTVETQPGEFTRICLDLPVDNE